jgi:putative ATPase
MNLASEDAKNIRDDNIPSHLINPVYLSKEDKLKSAEYKYPHNYGGWVEQQYLPNKLKDKVYYVPSDNGFEKTVKEIRKNKMGK